MFCKRRWYLVMISLTALFYMFIFWLLLRSGNNESEKKMGWYLPKYVQRHGDILRNRSNLIAKLLHHFDPNTDVLVFFHIQKTGGTTFNTNLVQMEVAPPCECSGEPAEGACRCRDAQGYAWMFSRFTTSSSCGVHPPLMELQRCAPRFLSEADGYEKGKTRRFLYTTILREPVKRYLSEWHHVQKVGPWPSACHQGDPVHNCIQDPKHPLSLTDFLNCPGNPANNRQTHMLVSEQGHQCDDLDLPADNNTLSAAKDIIKKFHFFGLTEEQLKTEHLFQKQFGVGYHGNMQTNNNTYGDDILKTVGAELLEAVRERNKLDIALYDYAKKLFNDRLHLLKL